MEHFTYARFSVILLFYIIILFKPGMNMDMIVHIIWMFHFGSSFIFVKIYKNIPLLYLLKYQEIKEKEKGTYKRAFFLLVSSDFTVYSD